MQSAFKMVLTLLLGEHVVTSLVGLVLAMLTAGAVYVGQLHGQGWYLVALGLAAVGRMLKDFWKAKHPDEPIPGDEPPAPPVP